MKTAVTKAIATVKAVADSTHPNGEFDIVLSAPTEDRDGETVDAKAFGDDSELPDHLSMDIDHAMTVDKTVGSGVPSYDAKGNLRVRGTYASTELGQTVRTLVDEGHIRTCSVAFIRKATKKVDGKVHITKAELLNGAFTPVPSNRESVVLSSKALAAVDALHESRQPTSTKSIVGSIEALQDRVRDALRSDGRWAYVRGVIPDEGGLGSGTVIFERWHETASRYETFSQPYTDDGTTVTLEGTAVVVGIQEVVVTTADGDDDTKSTPGTEASTATPPAGSAANKVAAEPAGSKATGDPDPTTDELAVQLAGIQARALAALA